jgi:hypothetical protein
MLAWPCRMHVQEVQRLLFVMEAPEYCMRAFRENGVNGQDLLSLQEADMDDSRFKFPKNVQRKVTRRPIRASADTIHGRTAAASLATGMMHLLHLMARRMHLCCQHILSYPHALAVCMQVLRIAQAWRTFQSITGSPTKGFVTLAEYVSYYSFGRYGLHWGERRIHSWAPLTSTRGVFLFVWI